MGNQPPRPLGEPLEQLLGFIAGHAATAITLVNDPKSSLPAAGHALMETAKDVPGLLAAARGMLEVAAELDAEDGYTPSETSFLRAVSRGDRLRRAFVAGQGGEDGLADVIP